MKNIIDDIDTLNIFKFSRDPIFITDTNYRIKWYNNTYIELLQSISINNSDCDFREKTCYEAVGRGELCKECPIREIFDNKLEHGNEIECGLKNIKGEEIFMSLKAASIYDEENNQIGAIASIHDITKRKVNEQKLDEKTKIFDIININTNDMIGIVDFNFNIQFVSESVNELLGFSVEEYRNLKPTQRHSLESMAIYKKILLEELEKENIPGVDPKRNRVITVKMKIKDGSFKWFEGKVSFIRDDKGKPVSILAVSRDITEKIKNLNELKRSVNKFNTIFENAGAGIILLDKDGIILDVNKTFIEISGYQNQILQGNSVNVLFSEPDLDKYPLKVERVLSGETVISDRMMKKNDSTLFHVETITKMVDENLIVLLVMDLTSQDMQKKEVEISRHRYEGLFNYIDSGVAIYDVVDNEFIFKDINPAVESIEHISKDDAIGKSIVDIFPQAEELGFIDVFRQVNETGESKHIPLTLYKDERLEGWRENFIFKLPTGEIIAVYKDLTEFKKIEEALLKSEELFKLSFVTNPDAISISRLSDGKYIKINPGFTDIMGYSQDEIIGKTTLELNIWVNESDREVFVKDLLENGTITSMEAQFNSKSGSVLTALLSATVIEYDNEKHVIAFSHDISKIRKLEEDNRIIHEQFMQAQKLESVGRLAGGIAHDFNNILMVILGNTDVALEDCEKPSKVFDSLMEIKEAANRSSKLTNQMLGFARKQTVSPKVINLNNEISNIINMIKRLIGENIDLEWIPGSIDNIMFDIGQLDQIIANMAVNARDAIGGIGNITIETEMIEIDEKYCMTNREAKEGSYICMSISDSGHGIKNEILNNIFEPFFTTKKRGEGTGLGLSTVYGIMKQNGGFINVYSEIGHGTTFKIFFPSTHKKIIKKKKSQEKTFPEGHGEVILIVEDEKSILKLMKRMVEALGYKVITAQNPKIAIEKFNENSAIDLIISDVVMPIMTGKEMVNLIRKKSPNVKVLFTSGYTANVIAHNGILDDGIDFLQKPVSLAKLSEKLSSVFTGE